MSLNLQGRTDLKAYLDLTFLWLHEKILLTNSSVEAPSVFIFPQAAMNQMNQLNLAMQQQQQQQQQNRVAVTVNSDGTGGILSPAGTPQMVSIL